MNKKILIIISFIFLLFISFSFKRNVNAEDSSVITFDSNQIVALSHSDGVVVDFLKPEIKEYWEKSANDISALKEMYEMNSGIESFVDNSYNHEYTRNLYALYDDFKPVNNVLTWKSNVKASSFDIKVSLNSSFTETVYEEKGLTEECFTLSNPLSNTHYFWQVTAHTSSGIVKSSIFDFYSGENKRTIDIESVSNTRDVGGFTSQYGRMIEGLIYRSGRLDDINSNGKEDLKALNIQTDLDLRNKGEGLENPAGLNNYYLKTLIGYSNDIADLNRSKTIETLRVFADENNYPIIFHCAVGRDRTGTLGIILQALCGASKEYIIHDYYTSMWSVTGAYQKTLEDLNLSIVMDVLNKLEAMGTSLSDGCENFLKERYDEATNTYIGLTDEEIKSIRDIWSGKKEVPHALKPFKADDNYEGKVLVKIKTLSQGTITMMVNKGVSIDKPYTLDSTLSYYQNKKPFDFSTPIREDTYIYTDYNSLFKVTLHFVGITKDDIILNVGSREDVDFDLYKVDGYNMLILSDKGNLITGLKVTRDELVNIMYVKE